MVETWFRKSIAPNAVSSLLVLYLSFLAKIDCNPRVSRIVLHRNLTLGTQRMVRQECLTQEFRDSQHTPRVQVTGHVDKTRKWGSPSSLLSYKHLKLKLTVFLPGCIVAMVICCVKKMTSGSIHPSKYSCWKSTGNCCRTLKVFNFFVFPLIIWKLPAEHIILVESYWCLLLCWHLSSKLHHNSVKK